ncbi:hypothetical protein [Oerskovia enterophila]|uniref:hypothetical protein n=1 Tax=Oerskovia enterophila TaxID=43678 RepID=UPI00380FD85B
MVLTGGSSAAIAAGRLTDRGVTSSDQPIALVPVPNGSAVVGTPIDLRCWTGEGGGLVAEDVAALQYLGSKGTTVRIGRTMYTRLVDGTGTLYWDDQSPVTGTVALTAGYGTYSAGYPTSLRWHLSAGVVTLSGFVGRTGATTSVADGSAAPSGSSSEIVLSAPMPEEIRPGFASRPLGIVASYLSNFATTELLFNSSGALTVRHRRITSTGPLPITQNAWWVALDGVQWRAGQ